MIYLKDIKKFIELRNAFTLFYVLIEFIFKVAHCFRFLGLRLSIESYSYH